MKIVIAAATGNVARRTLESLVQTDAQVVALVRHPDKLPEALRSTVQVEVGDLEDQAFVTQATRGADALLWQTPGTFTAQDFKAYTLRLAHHAVQAIRANLIHRVVFLSSHGADRTGLGQVSFAGEVEHQLAAAAPHTLVLRSAGFMENLFTSIETLRRGQLFGVLPFDKKYPLVTARDVGEVAARWLLDPNWSGHQVRGVHGPVDLSAEEQAAIIGAASGTSVRYQQLPAEALRDSLMKRGASVSVADAFAAMFEGFAQPDYRPTEPRTVETTTPTTLAAWVREVLAPRLR